LLVHGLTVRDGASPLERVKHDAYVPGRLSA